MIQQIKFILKLTVAHALYGLGVLQLWQRIVLRKKAVVLMYHRVLTKEDCGKTGSSPGIVVDRDAFATQMALVRQCFKVLSIEEFADHMEKRIPFEDASCLITFDDGWRDNYEHAFLILRQHELPAVVFLPVNYIGSQRLFWQEQLTHVVIEVVALARQEPSRRQHLGSLLASVGLESLLDLTDQDSRPVVIEAVRRQKGLDPSVIAAALKVLGAELGMRDNVFQEIDGYLNWEQVGNMAKQGVAFGGHGAEHRILTFVQLDEAREEIRTAKQVLDAHQVMSVPVFSYPNGNWSSEVAKLVEEAGYRLAFTTEYGYAGCDDDRFAIRRINIHEGLMDIKPMFLARIVGLF